MADAYVYEGGIEEEPCPLCEKLKVKIPIHTYRKANKGGKDGLVKESKDSETDKGH